LLDDIEHRLEKQTSEEEIFTISWKIK